MSNEIEQRVLDAIDMDGLVAFLCEMIAIPSLDGQSAEVAVQEHVADWMRRNGLKVDLWELDFASLRQHPAFCWEVEREHGLGLVGILGEDRGGRSLIFNGHTDVVPAGDAANWRFPAWQGTVDNGRVYGRGAVDMKGGLCCALFAAKALHDAGVQLKGRLMVESVIGEEDGGVGTLAAVLRGYSADGAVIIEPTRSEEHTSELQSLTNLVCRLLLEKKKQLTAPSRGLPRHDDARAAHARPCIA